MQCVHANVTMPLLLAICLSGCPHLFDLVNINSISVCISIYDGVTCVAAQLEADLAAALKRIAELEAEVAGLQAQVQNLEQALATASIQLASLQASADSQYSCARQRLLTQSSMLAQACAAIAQPYCDALPIMWK